MTVLRGLLLVSAALVALSARAFEVQPLRYFNFVDKRQASFLGPAQTRLSFGGDFTPAAGTTIVATQVIDGNVEVSRGVPFLNSPALPNQFFRSLLLFPQDPALGFNPITPKLTGAWKLTWTNPDAANNGGFIKTLPICPTLCFDPNDPSVTPENPFAPPFISDITTRDTSTTPRLTWKMPDYANPPDTIKRTNIFIFDVEDNGRAIFVAGQLPAAACPGEPAGVSCFDVPPAAGLKPGHRYLFSVENVLRNIADVGALPGLGAGSELASSRSFFDYMPTTGIPFDNPVFLPRVDNTGVFRFDFEVVHAQPYLIDPFVAIGYTFAIGPGDPLFASVTLPNLGPFNYTISLFDGTQFVPHAVVPPGVRFTFATPVDRFRARGIPPELALNPENPTAFVTEVTFAGDGRFTGSMTPIAIDPAADHTPPTSIGSVAPAANAAGWNNSDALVTITATDNQGGSGVQTIAWTSAGAQPGGATINGQITTVPVTTEGTTTFTFGAVDFAGNAEAPHGLTVKLDKTAPMVNGLPAADCALWPPNGKMVRVATIAASDALSGVASLDVVASSNEPAGAEPDVRLVGTSPGPIEVWLRAARLGSGAGRTYTIATTARDIAGNTRSATASCRVPHDQRK